MKCNDSGETGDGGRRIESNVGEAAASLRKAEEDGRGQGQFGGQKPVIMHP